MGRYPESLEGMHLTPATIRLTKLVWEARRDPRIREQVIACTASSDPLVREAAAIAVGIIKPPVPKLPNSLRR